MDTKIIKEEYVLRNLEREARILSALCHPCIAALYETIRSGSVYYLIMELASGGNMCTYIKAQKDGKLDERNTRNFARQLVSAIAHMHTRGIVHRDLKMENIMLSNEKNRIKIVDFGLSNIWNPDDPLRTHCGSPEYAAPELFVIGRHYGPEVDLWSLGVIVYGMITGRLPFVCCRDEKLTPAEHRQKLLQQINKGLTNSHKRDLTFISTDLKLLLTQLLQPIPEKRMVLKQLFNNSWLTYYQRKLLRHSPMGKLQPYCNAVVTRELSNMLQINKYDFNYEIASNRFGSIGGMFNIRLHEQLLKSLTGDGISCSPKTGTGNTGGDSSLRKIQSSPAQTKTSTMSDIQNKIKSIEKDLKTNVYKNDSSGSSKYDPSNYEMSAQTQSKYCINRNQHEASSPNEMVKTSNAIKARNILRPAKERPTTGNSKIQTSLPANNVLHHSNENKSINNNGIPSQINNKQILDKQVNFKILLEKDTRCPSKRIMINGNNDSINPITPNHPQKTKTIIYKNQQQEFCHKCNTEKESILTIIDGGCENKMISTSIGRKNYPIAKKIAGYVKSIRTVTPTIRATKIIEECK